MKFAPSRIAIKHPKRVIIIVGSILVFIGLATYAVFSLMYWSGFSMNNHNGKLELLSRINATIGTSEAPSDPATSIDKLVSDFAKEYGQNPCQAPAWYAWQTVIPKLKDMQGNCDKDFARTKAGTEGLKVLSQYLKDEKKAAALIMETVNATKAPTDFQAASKLWESVGDSKELPSSQNFAIVRLKIIEVRLIISNAYGELDAANKNEDKAAFDAASEGLKNAYAKLDELKAVATTERNDAIKSFLVSYEKL